jgi:hypothetical protein
LKTVIRTCYLSRRECSMKAGQQVIQVLRRNYDYTSAATQSQNTSSLRFPHIIITVCKC